MKKDSAELYWNLVPPDPSYKNDLVMYYEVQWKGNTGHVFEPNVTINGLGVCEDFPVSIIAVGNGTESDETLTRIRTGLDPDSKSQHFLSRREIIALHFFRASWLLQRSGARCRVR